MEKGMVQNRICYSLRFSLLIVLFLLGQVTSILASDLGLSEADCRCCHGATLADRHHLLVNTSGRECLSCHPLTYNSTTLEYDLTVNRDCLICHTGSLADRHHLLVDQVTYDCLTCHAVVWDPVALQYVASFNNACVSSNQTVAIGAVAGSVADQNGSGLGWARIATADGIYSTLATATGSYELPDMTPGTYTLVATLDGYVGDSQSVSVVDGQTLSIEFTLLPLTTPATVSGFVSDSNQVPLEGASVASLDGVYSTQSAADGSYTLDNMAPGAIDMKVYKSGYMDVSQTVPVTAGQNISQDFVLSNAIEICEDSIDNDGNGLTDCDDPVCSDAVSCQSSVGEVCDDGLDNNNNGLTDCSDPLCIGTGNCESPVAEICNDLLDNNGDGLLDCDDPLCNAATNCLPEDCDDENDNNGDGLIDCNDPVCADTRTCRPPPVEICDDGHDNDHSGHADCDDEKCADKDGCSSHVADERCKNGIDDNGDGFIDCADVLCQSRAVCLSETCDNDLDDDADGRVDCEDRECRETAACSGTTAGLSLDFVASAADAEDGHKAENVGDKDLTSYWMTDRNHKQWLKLDLGGIYPVDKVDIYWHTQYADRYNIRVSKNGRYWKKVHDVSNGDGGYDSNAFNTREARFILIKCKSAVTTGFSIQEVEVFRGSEN